MLLLLFVVLLTLLTDHRVSQNKMSLALLQMSSRGDIRSVVNAVCERLSGSIPWKNSAYHQTDPQHSLMNSSPVFFFHSRSGCEPPPRIATSNEQRRTGPHRPSHPRASTGVRRIVVLRCQEAVRPILQRYETLCAQPVSWCSKSDPEPSDANSPSSMLYALWNILEQYAPNLARYCVHNAHVAFRHGIRPG